MLQYGTHFLFIILPLFIFMAEVMFFTGIGDEAFNAAHKWLGRLPGGLCMAGVVACGIFAAVCGSSTATAATIGLVAMPGLMDRGYAKDLSAGSLAAGGTLGILIPPSGIMILYGIITETSIGDLFIAGFIPGIMMVALFCLYILFRAVIKPEAAPPLPGVSWSERFSSLIPIWAVIVVMLVILGGIYAGVATPTEVAALGAFITTLFALGRGKLSWSNLRESFLRTARTTCFVFFIVIGAMSFGWLLAYLDIPYRLGEVIVNADLSPLLILVLMNVTLLFLGCFIDPAGMLVLTMPLFFPIAKKFGFDPVWFGVIMTMNMECGNITPPVGLNLFVMKGICPDDVTIGDIVKGVVPFFILLLVGMVLIIAFPQIALWLPGTMK
jgi:tripartite ATP-independent transporter DctM subunit